MYKIKNFIFNNRMAIGSIVLFSSVLFLLGFFVFTWGFDIDDCGVLYGSKVSKWTDIWNFFVGKDHYSLVWPSNYREHSQSFLNVFYRPLCRLFFAPQVALFGSAPEGYFLILVFFHAINTVLVFYILYALSNVYFLSLWASLLFAFHMSVASWMGWIAAQNYTITLTLILISVISFFFYLKSRKKKNLIIAYCCFLSALFMFELVIFFPFVMLGIFFIRDFFVHQLNLKIPVFRHYLAIVAPYFYVLGIFLGVRLACYPINAPSSDSIFMATLVKKIYMRIMHCYPDIASFLADFSGTALIFSGNFLIKMLLTVLFIFFIIILWIRSRYKVVVFFFAVSMLLALWPAMIKFYVGRYAYFALPFFVASLVLLLRYSLVNKQSSNVFFRVGIFMTLACFLFGNVVHTLRAMSQRSYDSVLVYKAYRQLALLLKNNDKAICFMGVPYCFRTGLAQAVWLQGINQDLPIYYDHQTFVEHGLDGDENSITIRPIYKGFHLVVNNPAINCFSGLGDDCSMGTRYVLAYHAANHAPTEMDYVFDDTYLQQDLLFITWDYAKGQFKVLETKPLV